MTPSANPAPSPAAPDATAPSPVAPDATAPGDVHVVRVVQFSDTHFRAAPGARSFTAHEPEDGLAAVLADAARAVEEAAAVVVTGDLADLGEPAAYERLGEALDPLPAPVYCLPGNHDRQDPLQACLPRPNVHLEPAVRIGNWLLLLLDTNADGREPTADGGHRDREDRVHAASQPNLTPVEAARARAILTAARAEHVFLWLHQPPLPETAPAAQGDSELALLVRDFPAIRAIGAGHLHGDLSGTFEGRPVYVCPSSFMSIDTELRRLDGPGYRTYLLHPDGRVETEVRTVPGPLTDAMRATPLPAFLADLLSGRATPEELAALDDAQFEARYGEPRPMARARSGRTGGEAAGGTR
ncbi:metallophosphoesterase [Streptomyces sp. TLI_053]|uniref:metallophosphoesterase n=1 Tax=Streptomyces sp. TLI_053 TaxID=1855352 RepID=UPI0013520E26|nr:metallophosphoesterase [Streptomyces sp. TLI_053]